jgi:hypothetical protein
MFLLITYDVATADERAGSRRLRRVAKACTSYGVRDTAASPSRATSPSPRSRERGAD